MSNYQAGQVWTYQTRAGEEASQLVVCHVDVDPAGGEIIHIALEGLAIQTGSATGHTIRTLDHLPMRDRSLDACAIACVGERSSLPDFQDSYRAWSKSFAAGKAITFEQSLSEAIASIEAAIAAPVTEIDFEVPIEPLFESSGSGKPKFLGL